MSTIQNVNFEVRSDPILVGVRDFYVADTTQLVPTNATCYFDGEWLVFNATGQLVRSSTIGAVGNCATLPSFPLYAERGRYDMQASRKAPIILFGSWEADTRVFDASVALGAGAAITTVNQPLKIATITIGARNYTGVVGHGGLADNDPIVGYVTLLPANNGGRLRMRSGSRH